MTAAVLALLVTGFLAAALGMYVVMSRVLRAYGL